MVCPCNPLMKNLHIRERKCLIAHLRWDCPIFRIISRHLGAIRIPWVPQSPWHLSFRHTLILFSHHNFLYCPLLLSPPAKKHVKLSRSLISLQMYIERVEERGVYLMHPAVLVVTVIIHESEFFSGFSCIYREPQCWQVYRGCHASEQFGPVVRHAAL